MARTIDSMTVTIARASVGKVNFDQYIDKLLTAVYELPGVVVETEIDVNPGEETTFAGVVNGKPDDAVAVELKTVADKILAKMQK